MAARRALKKTPIHYLPDSHYIWTVNAIRALPAVFRREKIDVIHSVSAPYASHIVAYAAKRLSGKPWLCNLVDFWAAQPAEHFDRYRWLNYWLQDRCCAAADRIVTSTREIMDLTAARYHRRIRDKFECILPSFDPIRYPTEYHKHLDKYVFTFLGVFYQKKREPYTLLKALQAIKEGKPAAYKKLAFNLVGIEPAKWLDAVEEHGVADVVRLVPRVDFSESMRLMKEAGVLLHIGYMSGKFPQDMHISGKLSEYLGAHRLILALTTPEGPVADFIRRTGGVVADYRDPDDIKKAVIRIVETTTPARLYKWTPTKAAYEYDVRRAANRYLDILNEVTSQSGKIRTNQRTVAS